MNKADLLVKNFDKEMYLSGFFYRIEEAKGIKVGREECKVKYVVENSLLRSPPPKTLEDESFCFLMFIRMTGPLFVR